MGVIYRYASKDLGPIELGTSEQMDLPYKLWLIQLHLLTANINPGTIPWAALHHPHLVSTTSPSAELFMSQSDWISKDI